MIAFGYVGGEATQAMLDAATAALGDLARA